MRKIVRCVQCFMVIGLLFVSFHAFAQEQVVVVPDVTGLNLPQAAARLNSAGLRLGTQNAQAISGPSEMAGIVTQQSVSAGQTAAPGSTVNLIVLSASNVRLIYDDNDMTLINNTGAVLDLTGIIFNSSSGAHRLLGSRWRGDLKAGDCTQIWSISRRQSKNVEGCSSIYWLTTNNTSEHVWTQTAGVTEFFVLQNGVPVVTCPAAPPNSENNPAICEFYMLMDSDMGGVTEYVYFAYTLDHFAVINTSVDAWMPLANTPIYSPTLPAQNGLILGDARLLGSPQTIANVQMLAPRQCLLFTAAALNSVIPPQDCDVIAQQQLAADTLFWRSPFQLAAVTLRGQKITCPAADSKRMTICVMPR